MSPLPRRAIVLAAGQGERLWPLTATQPKPLVPVANETLLARILGQLAGAGLDHVTVVTAGPEGPVADHARRVAKTLDLELDIAVQRERLGTGHALQQVDLPDEPVVVTYGDLFLEPDALQHLIQAGPTGAIGALEVADVTSYGALALDGDRLVGIEEKPAQTRAGLANAGVYVLPAGAQAHLAAIEPSPRGELELTDALTAAVTAGLEMVVHPFEHWLDVGWPWDVLAANERALSELEGEVLGEVEPGAQLIGPVRVEPGATVRAGAVIQGPALIGPGATVGPNAYIRAATTLGPNAKVGHGCEVKNSVLFEGAKVPHVSYVGDSVLGRNVNLGAGTQVANLRHDGADLLVDTPKGRIDSGRRKLGVILGDGVKTGINATLNCGVLMGPGELVGPGEVVKRSRLPPPTQHEDHEGHEAHEPSDQ